MLCKNPRVNALGFLHPYVLNNRTSPNFPRLTTKNQG